MILDHLHERCTIHINISYNEIGTHLSMQIGAGCGMLSVDDTSFVKKGKHSAGVKRQYCDCLGKTENCQSGVFLAYAGDKGYGLVDYELYIPKEWFSGEYSELRKECHIPEEKTFATKNEIALPCRRKPELCENRGRNMALSEEVCR